MPKKNQRQKLLRQEIAELTAALNGEWLDLKRALKRSGLDLKNAYLISYDEDERGGEHGLVLTADKTLVKFVVRGAKVKTTKIRDTAASRREFPQIKVALELES